TSTLLRKHYNTRRNGHFRENKHHTSPTQLEFTAPESVPIDKPVIQRPKYHRFVPRVPCHLRPAVKDDMMEACVIYNWEVRYGFQAPDSRIMKPVEFENIFSTTQQLGMPFIV